MRSKIRHLILMLLIIPAGLYGVVELSDELLLESAQTGDLKTLAEALKQGFDPDQIFDDTTELSCSQIAIQSAQLNWIKQLIKSPKYQLSWKQLLFCSPHQPLNELYLYSAKSGQLNILKLLIQQGAQYDAKNRGGLTALHHAVMNDDRPMMIWLITEAHKTTHNPVLFARSFIIKFFKKRPSLLFINNNKDLPPYSLQLLLEKQ